ncbi:hypothetical protein DWY69_30340 [Eisenbergiella massiliensis]|uniref:Uncharacterized protein n=1 Tax=Eisenbergiella massiliensis TaxID=1720294 RepID=A0A3E3I6M9_9FIRM|nr:hypothetical protein DWY69_30340 [Eisenbergiella massiliensis]RGE61626.1 hypothetical protein DXC51_08670 [Eisenbergiella massiliensis]
MTAGKKYAYTEYTLFKKNKPFLPCAERKIKRKAIANSNLTGRKGNALIHPLYKPAGSGRWE